MCVFTLMTVFSGVLAWFSMNKDADASGATVTVENKEFFKKISYHQHLTSPVPTDDACSFSLTPYVSMSYDSNTRSFSSAISTINGSSSAVSSFDLVMEQYDPMNKHKPILVIAELSEEVDCTTNENGVGGVRVLASTTTTDFLGRKDDNTHQAKYSLGSDSQLKIATIASTDYYPLSSVVCFKAKAFSQDEYDDWISGKQAYEVSGLTIEDEDEDEDEDERKWLEPVDHNFSEADVDSDTSYFYNRSTIYTSENSGNELVKYIAIIVDYYDLAIEYIYSTFLGNAILENTYEYVLNFTCDWKWEIG